MVVGLASVLVGSTSSPEQKPDEAGEAFVPLGTVLGEVRTCGNKADNLDLEGFKFPDCPPRSAAKDLFIFFLAFEWACRARNLLAMVAKKARASSRLVDG